MSHFCPPGSGSTGPIESGSNPNPTPCFQDINTKLLTEIHTHQSLSITSLIYIYFDLKPDPKRGSHYYCTCEKACTSIAAIAVGVAVSAPAAGSRTPEAGCTPAARAALLRCHFLDLYVVTVNLGFALQGKKRK